MSKQKENAAMLDAVLDAKDHMPPAEWRLLVSRILNDNEPAPLDTTEQAEPLTAADRWLNDEYKGWKKLLAIAGLVTGLAYERSFWSKLAHSSGTSALAGVGLGPYADLCASTLMGEVLKEFTNRPLSEAEQWNDAGFEHHHQGGYEQAIESHDRALALAPDFALAWINKGIALKNLRRWDEAIAAYDHVIEQLDPAYKKAWHNKGVALMEKALQDHDGQPQFEPMLREAIDCFDHALGIDGGYEIARRVRDACHAHLRSARIPAPQFPGLDDEALRRNPQLLGLLQMLDQLQSFGNWPAAARLGEQILQLLPDQPDILVAVGNAQFESGQRQEAEERFRKAVALYPEHGHAWLNLARCLLEHEDWDGALDAAQRATTFAPDAAMGWVNLSAVLTRQQRYADAFQAAAAAFQLESHNSLAMYYLGANAWLLGDHDTARTTLTRLLELDPDFRGAGQVREILVSLS